MFAIAAISHSDDVLGQLIFRPLDNTEVCKILSIVKGIKDIS